MDEKVQATVDKLWDQQTAFEDRTKTTIAAENKAVKQELLNLRVDVEEHLQNVIVKNKEIVHNVIAMLKETASRLEKYL